MKKLPFISILLCLALPLFVIADGEDVTYMVDDQYYEGYYVDAGKDATLVIILHDWDGLTDYEKKRAHMLADAGFSAFAADLYGKGVRPTEVKDKRQHTGELYQDRAKMRALLNGAVVEAKSLGLNTEKMVAMGYCFGGAAVLEMARSGAEADAFITFHGGLSTPEGQDYSKTQGMVMVFHGTADSMITMQDFATLATELEDANIAHEMTTYGGAPHAFTVFGSDRYDQAADEASWARFMAFLNAWNEQK